MRFSASSRLSKFTENSFDTSLCGPRRASLKSISDLFWIGKRFSLTTWHWVQLEDDSDVVFECVFALLLVSFVDFVIGLTMSLCRKGCCWLFANEFTNMYFVQQTNKILVPTKSHAQRNATFWQLNWFNAMNFFLPCKPINVARLFKNFANTGHLFLCESEWSYGTVIAPRYRARQKNNTVIHK